MGDLLAHLIRQLELPAVAAPPRMKRCLVRPTTIRSSLSGVTPPIWSAIHGLAASRLVVVGNPIRYDCHFRELHDLAVKGSTTIKSEPEADPRGRVARGARRRPAPPGADRHRAAAEVGRAGSTAWSTTRRAIAGAVAGGSTDPRAQSVKALRPRSRSRSTGLKAWMAARRWHRAG